MSQNFKTAARESIDMVSDVESESCATEERVSEDDEDENDDDELNLGLW